MQDGERKPLEHQHAGQRDDEGRDLEIGNPIALRRTDHRANHEAGEEGERISDMIAHHQYRRDRADKAGDRAHRQVDVAGDDD